MDSASHHRHAVTCGNCSLKISHVGLRCLGCLGCCKEFLKPVAHSEHSFVTIAHCAERRLEEAKVQLRDCCNQWGRSVIDVCATISDNRISGSSQVLDVTNYVSIRRQLAKACIWQDDFANLRCRHAVVGPNELEQCKLPFLCESTPRFTIFIHASHNSRPCLAQVPRR